MARLLVVGGVLLTFLLVGTGIAAWFMSDKDPVGWVFAGLVVGFFTLVTGLSVHATEQKRRQNQN